jgi:hypothetical protein
MIESENRTSNDGALARLRRGLLLGLALAVSLSATSQATTTLTFEGNPIVGQNEDYIPIVTAAFTDNGDNTLTLVLTYEGYQTGPDLDPIDTIGEALSGLVFELPGVSLSVMSIDLGLSTLVGANTNDPGLSPANWDGSTLTGEWGFQTGFTGGGFTDAFVINGVGTVLFVEEGVGQVVDPTENLTGNTSTDGPAFMIIPDELDLEALCPSPTGSCPGAVDGFFNQGPMIQDSITAVFGFSGELPDLSGISATPIFGTEGAPPVPEPTAGLLFAAGSVVVGLSLRKRAKP